MAREALLDRVPIAVDRVHRIGGDEPSAAAAAYEHAVRAALATPAGPPPTIDGRRFDLVLLGMGSDGHTASLFPGSAALAERERWAVAAEAPVAPVRRVTLTFPVINAAADVVFLVAGADKAPRVRDVIAPPPGVAPLPAHLVAPTHGRVRWLLDAAAAADLAPPR
jgi:6-phosphogluconolactonase